MAEQPPGRGSTTTVLVVGQTPPPFHGQAIMIQALLEGSFTGELRLHHVRMAFSRSMEEIGRPAPRKALELGRLVVAILRARRRSGANILYYPPAGPQLVPVLRDLVILSCVRPFFRRTVFHFHAGGIGTFTDALPWLLRPWFRHAYGQPDVAVRISQFAPDDGRALGARRRVVIPNGIADHADGRRLQLPDAARPEILFVGRLGARKGTDSLIAACASLRERGVAFRLQLVGSFESVAEEQRLRRHVADHDLEEDVDFAGVLTGEQKWSKFAAADIFCYPSRHETETFGIAAVEAMSFGLPVVATRWRGLAEVVEHGATGFLVPPGNEVALADRLERLVSAVELRRRMGAAGRRRYEALFSLEHFHRRFEALFRELAAELVTEPVTARAGDEPAIDRDDG